MELARVGAIVRRMVHGALEAGAPPARLAADRAAADRLIEAVGDFAGDVSRTALPEFLESALPTALRVSRHYSEVAELAQGVAARREALEAPELESASAGIAAFRERILELVDRAAVERADYDAEAGAALLERVEGDYQALKAALLHAGASGRIPVRALVDALDVLSDLHRLAKQIERAARFLERLGEAGRGEPGAEPADVA
jgi:phosphate:Na+ symporter